MPPLRTHPGENPPTRMRASGNPTSPMRQDRSSSHLAVRRGAALAPRIPDRPAAAPDQRADHEGPTTVTKRQHRRRPGPHPRRQPGRQPSAPPHRPAHEPAGHHTMKVVVGRPTSPLRPRVHAPQQEKEKWVGGTGPGRRARRSGASGDARARRRGRARRRALQGETGIPIARTLVGPQRVPRDRLMAPGADEDSDRHPLGQGRSDREVLRMARTSDSILRDALAARARGTCQRRSGLAMAVAAKEVGEEFGEHFLSRCAVG